MRTVRRVAVLGAGTMGSRIAAHFANAGIPALLLDLKLPGEPDPNAAAVRGLRAAEAQRPAAFFTAGAPRLITPGNFEDDLGGVQACDWVIEAVTEDLEIKRALLERVARWRRPETLVSTNTSGIPLARIADGFSPEFRRNFLGTHFFNPPRYLHLLELIPGPDTDPAVMQFVQNFCDLRLGKGVVRCKDTPNFIGNRIGSFFGCTAVKIAVEGGYRVEEVDAITGPLIGLPRSATFRLIDLIGVDVWLHVARNVYELVPDDPWRERFRAPDFLHEMVKRGWLGEKSGQGFYRRVGKGVEREIQVLDWNSFEYHPAVQASFPSVEAVRGVEDLGERLRKLAAADDRAGSFLWNLFSDHVIYAAGRVPEIADRIVEIDRAMRWGYAHQLGPFELWDTLGLEETVARMKNEGRAIPAAVEAMLASGAKMFYRPADEDGQPHTEYFDLIGGSYRRLEERPGVLVLSDIKRARRVVRKNAGASLIDLGDGALCLEFHARNGAIGEDQIAMICTGIDEAARNFQALVIAHEGENFGLGADLKPVLAAARHGAWDDLDASLQRFQQAMMTIKYAPAPVVVAPFAQTLGTACELALHAARIQASAETYMGLAEVSLGLIPAGGGCKELLLRLGSADDAMDLIVRGRISSSAGDARKLGFLRAIDGVSMNPERLLADAKTVALSLSPTYSPGLPRIDIRVSGEAGLASLKVEAWLKAEGHLITDYDRVVAQNLAYVLSGGRLTSEQHVSEQYLLDLEREAFLSLCGNRKTQERIEHMLKTGKPLRN